MVVAEGNVAVVGVKADFDFCQSTVKRVFNDAEFRRTLKEKLNVEFTSANSINWGRLLPQVIYSVFAYMELARKGVVKFGESVDVCIPSGNFGNILGAFLAKKMGLPIERLVCASNENNILTDFLNTGVFSLKGRHLETTISPAIDILNPSNLERLLSLLSPAKSENVKHWYSQDLQEKREFEVGEDIKKELKRVFFAACCTQKEVQTIIKHELAENQILWTPTLPLGKQWPTSTSMTKPTIESFYWPGLRIMENSRKPFCKRSDKSRKEDSKRSLRSWKPCMLSTPNSIASSKECCKRK